MLEAQNIQVNYGAREALRNVSLRAEPGQVTAVIGPNGAGKSTFLRALNGAQPLAGGTLLLDGAPLSSYSRRAVSRRLAVVAQEADLRFPVTVIEFVLGGRFAWANAGAWGWESERDLVIAEEVLRETELQDFDDRPMNELSGGERQRAVLARALATEAPILLLDEPTANLDLSHQATMMRLVRGRCDQHGAAAVVVTHDINLAAQFADRVLLLKDGSTVAEGPPRSVLSSELLRNVFAMQVLVDAHPTSGAPRITPVYAG
jgi:iron complex transport system ATP-binding protein